MERVTAQPQETNKQPKNPKKVAAGRAGAEARRLKNERLLQELRTAKQTLLSPPHTANYANTVPSERAPYEPAPGPQMKTASVSDWTTWPFLKSVGAGLVGAAAIFLLLRATPSLLMLQPTITNSSDNLYQQQQDKSRALTPAVLSTRVPAAYKKQLNTVPHPLYME